MSIRLLGCFGVLERGRSAPTSPGSERLLAFVALHPPSVRRTLAAGTLWPNVAEHRAYASLRSAVARLDETSRHAIDVSATELAISPRVTVDLREARDIAVDLLASGASPVQLQQATAALPALAAELLPGWYEDWVLAQAEDWRRLRVQALESLAARLIAAGHFGFAASAAGAAIRAEPLRESARAALIRVHLAEGNQAEALDQYRRYEEALLCELGVHPTTQLRNLLGDLLGAVRAAPSRNGAVTRR